MNRALVIFDGNNFYHKVKAVSPSTSLSIFQYRNFVQSFVNERSCIVQYHVGEIKNAINDPKTVSLYRGQQILFSRLRRQNVMIKLGTMLKTKDVYHEKGVDVMIAIEILKGALRNTYDTCYLVSSDSDLVPAVKEATQENKKIVYIAFDRFVSTALLANCNKTILITKELLKKYSI